jgi:tetratricopeptide (TPR) repeat protein
LAQDVAYWWITQGSFARALPVLRSTLRHLTQPSDQLTIYGNIARAAGGMGDRDEFRQAWDACHDLLHDASVSDRAAQALLDLAHGAASLGLWDKAEAAAREALEVGSRRQEAKIRLSAEALMDSVRHHRAVATATRTVKPAFEEASETLAENLVRSLTASAHG